jgi:FkbM family methyltransferase
MSNAFDKIMRRTGLHQRISWYLTKLNYRRRVTVKNAEFVIPHIHGIHCNLTETWMTDLLAVLLPGRAGVFLDVGANVGQSLLKLKAVAQDIAYVGFEPNPSCASYLEQLIRANSFSNCTVVPAGLYTKDTLLMLNLFSSDETDTTASIVEGFRPGHNITAKQIVAVACYETVEAAMGIGEVGTIKIDVEGGELEVIQSLLAVIKRDRPYVLLEILPAYSADNTFRVERQTRIETLFKELGYQFFRVVKSPDDSYSGLSAIDTVGIHGDLTQCDYVLAPGELTSHLAPQLRDRQS